jgi:transposase
MWLAQRYNYSVDTKSAAKRRIQIIKGVSYVYEDYPYWDKARKQNRHRREYIGKLGQEGEFIPNKNYLARQYDPAKKGDAAPTSFARRFYYGATHLLDEISKLSGIQEDLQACFPNTYKMWMSLAYYLVLESDSPMYRFPRWAFDHQHPWGEELSSQRISEMMRDLPEGAKLEFFKRQSQRRLEKEYLAYDTTSVSSFSEYIKAVRYGRNKDNDDLPQVNMALVFGEESGLPVYYRVLPGNITDVMTIRKLVKDIDFLEIDKLKLVLDRGFFSASNINALFKGHHKFLIAVKANIGVVSGVAAQAKCQMHDFAHYDVKRDVYHWSSMEEWLYVQQDRHGNIALEEKRRVYVHIYYNGLRAEEEKIKFNKALAMTEAAIKDRAELTRTQASLCDRYFVIKEMPKRGLQIQYKEEAIQKHMANLGYFILLSNDIKNSAEALDVYRRKDMVEKAFDNLKERLEMKRTGVHSDQTLAGKFFLQFLALIYVSYIHKHMRDHDLYKNYTLQSLLDTLDVIERYEYESQRYHCSEITKKQQDIYACFGISPPNTL